MRTLSLPLRTLFADRRGANLVEYIILVGVVALLALAAFRFFGKSVRATVDKQSVHVQTDIPGTPTP